jgi:hypothetical protein
MLGDMSPENLAMQHNFLEGAHQVWSYYVNDDEQRRYDNTRNELSLPKESPEGD